MSKTNDNNIDFLWRSFLKGDDKSFAIIYQRHIDGLLSYGYKLSADREVVHDCLQEVFMDLFLKRGKLGVKIENLKSYLFVAFRHSLIKKITKNKKVEMQGINADQEDSPFFVEYSFQDSLIDLEISNEIKSKLTSAVSSLPAKQKEIIYLKFEEELEYTEISEVMKISVESSRKLLYRALLSLRKIVDPDTVQILFSYFFQK